MSNTQVPSPIPLTGRGYVAKLKGNYQPGEYRQLANAVISGDDGILKNRRNIQAFQHANYGSFTNVQTIKGNIDTYTIVASPTQHRAIDYNSVINLWAPTGLPVPAGGWHQIEGAFLYNARYYWITLAWDPAGAGTYTYYAYSYPVGTLGLADPGITVAGMTVSTLLTLTPAVVGLPPSTVGFFIQKDRLWLCTKDTLYFSKATDPLTFAVPDGGFFKIRDQLIRDVTFLGDNIYILGQNETHVLTYTTDPNDDAYLRKIADIGGESITIHGSTPYFVNHLGVYEIFNQTVTKINDLRLEYPYALDEANIKVISFENYLIIIARNFLDYNTTDTFSWVNSGPVFTKDLSNALINNFNVFFINMDTGATHVLDFTDSNDTAERGFIVDGYVNTVRDSTNDYKLILLTNKYISNVGGVSTYKANVYYMRPQNDWLVYDEARRSDDVLKRYKHRINIQIDSFVPDGSEYQQKKFRYLEAMAKLPSTDFSLTPAYDNKDFDVLKKMVVGSAEIASGRPHYPVRLPLNQRGKSFSLKLTTENPDTEMLVNQSWDQFELSDLRLLWTYTQRFTDKRYANA
jgi:hypothetical protein